MCFQKLVYDLLHQLLTFGELVGLPVLTRLRRYSAKFLRVKLAAACGVNSYPLEKEKD